MEDNLNLSPPDSQLLVIELNLPEIMNTESQAHQLHTPPSKAAQNVRSLTATTLPSLVF